MAPSIRETESIPQPALKQTEPISPSKSTDNHEEHQYLDLIREILETGEHRPDRYYPPHSSPFLQLTISPELAQEPTPSSRPNPSNSPSPPQTERPFSPS